MDRYLTSSEKEMLRQIFKNTLPYDKIVCRINRHNVGGTYNSITPAGIPYFSTSIFCGDFSIASDDRQWIFVHEMTHVWQWWHRIYPTLSAVGLFIGKAGQYENAYPYDLTPKKSFLAFNIEQQASIVADYWALNNNKNVALRNNDPQPALADYWDLIRQLQTSGPPVNRLDEDPLTGRTSNRW